MHIKLAHSALLPCPPTQGGMCICRISVDKPICIETFQVRGRGGCGGCGVCAEGG